MALHRANPTISINLHWMDLTKRWLITVTRDVDPLHSAATEWAETPVALDEAACVVLARAVKQELERWLPY